jgi:hypothetical protein
MDSAEIQTKKDTKTDNASAGVIIFMMVVLLRRLPRASMLPNFENGRCDMDHSPLILLIFQEGMVGWLVR